MNMSKRLQKKEELNFRAEAGKQIENNTKNIVTLADAIDSLDEKVVRNANLLAESVDSVSNNVNKLTESVDKISKTDFLTKKDLAGIKKDVTPKKGIDYDDGSDAEVDTESIKNELKRDIGETLEKVISSVESKLETKEIDAKNIKGLKDLLPKAPPMYGGGSGATFLKSMRDVDVSGLTKNDQGKYVLGSGSGGDNIYTADGTLSGDRSVSLDGNSILFEGETGADVEVSVGASANHFGAGVKGWLTSAFDLDNDDAVLQGAGDFSAFGLNTAGEIIALNAYLPDVGGGYYTIAKDGSVSSLSSDGTNTSTYVLTPTTHTFVGDVDITGDIDITGNIISDTNITADLDVAGSLDVHSDTNSTLIGHFYDDNGSILRVRTGGADYGRIYFGRASYDYTFPKERTTLGDKSILTFDNSGESQWVALNQSGVLRSVATRDTTTSLSLSEDFVLASNNITISLPSASGNTGKIFTIKKTDSSNTVTIDPDSTETIDGLTTLDLTKQNETITIVSNGTNWDIDSWFVPMTLETYTPSNVTETRTFDADSTNTAELADVLGTLIADLQANKIID